MKDGKYVVLCIDDDQDFLESLRIIIENNDYAMIAASSAEDGLRLYKQDRPDLIIVDLMMEEVDAGTNFVKEIKAMGRTPPVYMLTSVGDNLNLSADYSQLGLTGVLQKPISPKLLLSTLKAKLK
jgi:DNA-binding response OmpR family regulator